MFDRKKRKGADKRNLMYDAFLTLKNREEVYAFLADLCASVELGSMEQRLEVARLLRNGLSYNEILTRTGASSATISRVNRCFTDGTGGYEMVFSRLEEMGLIKDEE